MRRAVRRHHKFRMRKKARRIFNSWGNSTWGDYSHYSFLQEGKYADHLKSCSCHMCGNPRKFWNEKTRQELKAKLKTEENDVGE
jgi:hypothetical protein